MVFTVSPTGLAVARSLAPRGVAVWGVDPDRWEIGHASRWLRRDPRFSFLPPGPALLEALLAFGAEQAQRPVLFLGGDPYMDFVAEHHERLRDRFVLAESMRPEVLSVLLNKRTFYERCQRLGAAMPTTYFPSDVAEARAASAELRYPAIVKPTHAHLVRQRLGGNKLVEVGDAEALVAWWERFRAWGTDSVLQEIIPGPERNIMVGGVYMDAQLRCRSLFTGRKNRQYPPWYGSGSYMEACWSDEIAALSEDLLQRLEYRGVAGTEFKWDERDGVWKLIEVNPRPTLWFALTRAAGVDVVWDAYCDLLGRPNEVHVNCQDDRARWQLLVRDLVSSWHFLRHEDLGLREYWRTVVDPRGKEYAVLSLRDPGTLFAYPLNSFSKWWNHVRRRSS